MANADRACHGQLGVAALTSDRRECRVDIRLVALVLRQILGYFRPTGRAGSIEVPLAHRCISLQFTESSGENKPEQVSLTLRED